jgi:hypothetical protein
MLRSLALRRLASFARPRRGFSFLREGFEVRLAFTAVAQAGRDDATNDSAGLGPIGEDDGECDALRQTDGDDPLLALVPAVVFALQRRTFEYEAGKLEIESSET